MVTPALTKSDRSPVTVADFAVQALMARLLEQAFPYDRLVGEEDSHALDEADAAESLAQVAAFVKRELAEATESSVRDWIAKGAADPGGRFWTLDPIDGTKGFLRRDQYAVALALVEDGHVVVGILGCPNLSPTEAAVGSGTLVVAMGGEGAWSMGLDGGDQRRRLEVSDRRDPREARLLRSFESGHTDADKMSDVAASLGAVAKPVLMDSQAKYAVLASGQGELLFRLLSPKQPNYREKIWDQAAGALVIQEAGGTITDLDGRALDFTAGRQLERNRGVLASNGHLHSAALEAVARVSA